MPFSKACSNDMFESDKQILWPNEPFQFSYTVNFELSDKDWPHRLDHYLKM